MSVRKFIAVLMFLNLRGELSGLLWEQSVCAPDSDPEMPEGIVDNIGRFPWLGLIQYKFAFGDKMNFAVTTGVLIHPSFVLAPAVDIAKIPPDLLRNNTQFVVWDSLNVKYSLDVKDYSLHPEYSDGSTVASVALLELFPTGFIGVIDSERPLLPVCINLQGAVQLTDLYAIQMTEEQGELKKYVYKMNYVSETDCDEFYDKAGLGFSKMRPMRYVCAVSELQREACVWEPGISLVTRQAWGYWKLIGFGVRGAGCGAPARFVFIPSYMEWMDDVISMGDVISERQDDDTVKLYFRRFSPIKLAMMPGDTRIPTFEGQCDRAVRGKVAFKDGSELLVNQNFVQGFYLVSVTQLTEMTCAIVTVASLKRTNAAVWVEHHCHREHSGLEPHMKHGPDLKRLECFMYFKSKAFLEVRFFFSFRALIEITMYGHESTHWVGNPFETTWDTDAWEPTNMLIRWGSYYPYYIWVDSGYAQRPYLMTPISNAEDNSPKAFYNDLHSTARNSVERTIGFLKGRFRLGAC